MTLQGHVKGIMSLAFSPNGHLLASGSEDHTARLWDLRKRRCIYTLPCHTSLVSQVCRFCKHSLCCDCCKEVTAFPCSVQARD